MASRRADRTATPLLVCGMVAGPLFTFAWIVESVTRTGHDGPRQLPAGTLGAG